MIELSGNALKFYVFFVGSKAGATGLTVTVDVYNPAGTKIISGSAASEIGGGLYSYELSSGSVSAEGEYIAVFKTTDTSVDQQHIPALWVVDRAAKDIYDAIDTLETGGGDNNVVITIETDIGDPLYNATVKIFNVTNTVFITEKKTNAAGGAPFNLDDGEYAVRIFYPGYSFTSPETLTVSGDTNQTFSGAGFSLTPPESADACLVYEYCFEADDVTPLASVEATAKIVELPYDYGGKLHAGTETAGTYNNETGLVYWYLVKGATIDFDMPTISHDRNFKLIPDLTECRWTDLENV